MRVSLTYLMYACQFDIINVCVSVWHSTTSLVSSCYETGPGQTNGSTCTVDVGCSGETLVSLVCLYVVLRTQLVSLVRCVYSAKN